MFVSYAQNAEDVVLWRILKHITNGTYVDVGAADPVYASVSKAFYDEGWSGVNVEPNPDLAHQLVQMRPRDRTFQCAASDRLAVADFYVVIGTGLSSLDVSLLPTAADLGFESEQIRVQLRTLNDILDEAGLREKPIHFMKIDVEGSEADVLAGLDLSVWRPWVLVIEATKPMSTIQNYHDWEPAVVSEGYTFTLFDGLNRYYVADEFPELFASASFPVCIFDHPYRSTHHDDSAAPAAVQRAEAASVAFSELSAELEAREHQLQQLLDVAALRKEVIGLRAELVNVNEAAGQQATKVGDLVAAATAAQELSENSRRELERVVRSASWKLTKPLRVSRWLRRRRASLEVAMEPKRQAAANRIPPSRSTTTDRRFVERFCGRLLVVTNLLDPTQTLDPKSLEEAVGAFERAADTSAVSPLAKGWLAMVAVVGSYPDEATLERAALAFRRSGGRGLGEMMLAQVETASRDSTILESALEVVRNAVLVDVSHTAAHDLHTGIQRVVREVVSRWLHRPDVVLVQWNFSTSSIKRLSGVEAERLLNWRTWLHQTGAVVRARALGELTGKTVIPSGSVLVLPELVANPPVCSGYRSLARTGLIERCALIGYDTVPIAATETVTDGMTANFAHYLALVKHSSHLAAISESAAEEFRAFGQILTSQGLPGPTVTAVALPTQAPDLTDDDLQMARQEFQITDRPVIAVVGSHEPRKNHLAVLEAAESMWRAGCEFELVFAGGSGWGGSDFGDYVQALMGEGFPVRVYERISETSLWSLYRIALISVFPSLLEGYGLPIAESLVSGTPVVASNFGSMSEIAEGGGALLVNPRSATELATAMSRLLVDHELREELASAALQRVFPTWDEYADALWTDLVGLG